MGKRFISQRTRVVHHFETELRDQDRYYQRTGNKEECHKPGTRSQPAMTPEQGKRQSLEVAMVVRCQRKLMEKA